MAAAIILFLAVAAFRIGVPYFGGDAAMTLANFSPFAAVALCGAACLPPRVAAAGVFGTFLLTDAVLNAMHGHAILNPYSGILLAAWALTFALGLGIRRVPSAKAMAPLLIGGAVAGTIVFHLVSNTASFFLDAYPKSLAGWWQAQTVGLPQYSPPTWVFFLRSLAGNLFFTGLFIGLCLRPGAAPATRQAASSAPARASL